MASPRSAKPDPLDRLDDPKTWPRPGLVALAAPLADARGRIQPLLEGLARSALLIRSKKGALRANHYHKSDWHYSFVLSGSMEYYHRPAGSKERPERLLVRAGQMVFTPPGWEHAMLFPEDADFLVLSRNPRSQAAYEADVVRVEVIGEGDGLR